MNFAAFQAWRKQCLQADPGLMDCAETNLYRTLAALQPKPEAKVTDERVYRCDLARAWLLRYGFPADFSRRALICQGVRYALALIFRSLAGTGAKLWLPCDVYPVYLELAQDAGLEPGRFPTLPTPQIPAAPPAGQAEYLLIANPWKPLGRYLTGQECDDLIAWLEASPGRHLLMDCVYDLGSPFHATTQKLQATGRAILLHSVTKGWLWPKTFGVALTGEVHTQFESGFRDDSPAPDQLRLARRLLGAEAETPGCVAAALEGRAARLLAALPEPVRKYLLPDVSSRAPGGYFFPVGIPATELLRDNRLLAIPASAFGGDWNGSILTSLATVFAPQENGMQP